MPKRVQFNKTKGLNPRQKKFCLEYIATGSAHKAALNAGYSATTAKSRSAEWVKASRAASLCPEMWDYIKQLREEMENEYSVSRGVVLKGYHGIAALDIRRMFDEFGNLLDMDKMPDDIATSVAGVEIVETKIDGDTGVTTRLKKIKLGDRNAAWANIAKLLGYNKPEVVQHEAGESFLDLLKKTSASSARQE